MSNCVVWCSPEYWEPLLGVDGWWKVAAAELRKGETVADEDCRCGQPKVPICLPLSCPTGERGRRERRTNQRDFFNTKT